MDTYFLIPFFLFFFFCCCLVVSAIKRKKEKKEKKKRILHRHIFNAKKKKKKDLVELGSLCLSLSPLFLIFLFRPPAPPPPSTTSSFFSIILFLICFPVPSPTCSSCHYMLRGTGSLHAYEPRPHPSLSPLPPAPTRPPFMSPWQPNITARRQYLLQIMP